MEIRELPLGRKYYRSQAEAFLAQSGLRLEPVDYYAALYDGEGIVCAGGYAGATIKCVAVDDARRGEGLANTLLSHLITRMRRQGVGNIFLFTKPENEEIFRDLAFSVVGRTNQALLLESRKNGVGEFAAGLAKGRAGGVSGAVVMNANPFTLGHRYLLEEAAGRCDALHVFVVEEEQSLFPFAVRKRLVEEGTAHLEQVRVHSGGPYIISSATFPTYFLKEDSDTAAVHARLDIDIFGRHIAPALQVTRRFVGEEPLDPMTARYNRAMAELLPGYGVEPVVIPRKTAGGRVISASTVRKLAREGLWEELQAFVPPTTLAYLKTPEGAALFHAQA